MHQSTFNVPVSDRATLADGLASSDYSNGGTVRTNCQEQLYLGKYSVSLSRGNLRYAGEIKVKDL